MPREAAVNWTHQVYSMNGLTYCQTRSGKAKRWYATRDEALDAGDAMLDKDVMTWPYRHSDHWHLTSLVPIHLPLLAPAAWYSDGTKVKSRREKLGLPPRVKPAWKRFKKGQHFLRIT